jgi:hypothetical protein
MDKCIHGVGHWNGPNEFADWCQECQKLQRQVDEELNQPTIQRLVANIAADPARGKFAHGFSPKGHRG